MNRISSYNLLSTLNYNGVKKFQIMTIFKELGIDIEYYDFTSVTDLHILYLRYVKRVKSDIADGYKFVIDGDLDFISDTLLGDDRTLIEELNNIKMFVELNGVYIVEND